MQAERKVKRRSRFRSGRRHARTAQGWQGGTVKEARPAIQALTTEAEAFTQSSAACVTLADRSILLSTESVAFRSSPASSPLGYADLLREAAKTITDVQVDWFEASSDDVDGHGPREAQARNILRTFESIGLP